MDPKSSFADLQKKTHMDLNKKKNTTQFSRINRTL